MKRSNRLVLLIGVFLAIVAFIGILLISSQPTTPNGDNQVPTELPTVVATADIPLGTRIQADQVTTQTLAVDARDATAFQDVSQVIGQVARQPVKTGGQITAATLTGGVSGTVINVQVPVGQRAIAMRVDQISGVGTVISAARRSLG